MGESVEILLVEDNPNTDQSKLTKNQSVPQAGSVGEQLARFSLTNLSIKQRLPLLIGILLFGVITVSIWVSYRGVKDSALEIGRERLFNVAQQLATLLQQSANNSTGRTLAAANDPAIRAYLHSPLPGSRPKAAAVLQQFLSPQDPHSLRVELWDANHSLALALPEGSSPIPEALDTEFRQSASGPLFSAVGIIRIVRDTIAYPIIAAINDEGRQPIGYLVRWRRLATNPDARKQVMNLIGTRADIYVGNSQGDIWTDMANIVPKPPAEVRSTRDVVHYTREKGSPITALGRPINGTPWFVLVEFSDHEILAQSGRFLRRTVLISLFLFVVGVVGTLALSRSITRPLHSLTETASAITGGDYSRLAKIHTHDELGALASAFNAMVVQVRDSRDRLEQKVQERTAQLESANGELESFSYSVSHDLRAPLRAMAGFSRILIEEYGPRMPDEAQRYLRTVQNNAQQMGQLIDDLLGFSRLGRQALNGQLVSPSSLVREVLDDLSGEQAVRNIEIIIGDLPDCQADPALLKQVFINLLANALKFTRRKEAAVIEIGCLNNGNQPDGPIYFVKDNGAGFDMRYADKLFGVFQRLHRAEDYEGTGVGLATVQRIIRRHGGHVWAEAETGKGATFYFTLGGESHE